MQQKNTLVRLFMRTLLMVVSGGFATIQPGNLLSINAVEAYTLEDFSAEAVRSGLADAQRVASGSGSEEEVAEARIEVEVYEALQVLPHSMNLLMTRLLE
jgi:F0F1-type ATP synthase epsilon subunit